MNIIIPPSINNLAPQLQEFFDAMVFKLSVNSHKKAISEDDIDGLLAKMEAEIAEFREQRIQDAGDPNILAELADTSNFAFLIYAFLRARGVNTLRERFMDEYFDIDINAGKIYCRKTRSGSPLKLGDEVKGTGDPVRIRAQHSITGATVSVPRRDIVWWAKHGSWPERPLRYVNETPPSKYEYTLDRITNLYMSPERQSGKPQFVTQFRPKGREKTQNYGRYVYQRRHGFKLVRVGYWDTPQEAAVEGLAAWKEKIKGAHNVDEN